MSDDLASGLAASANEPTHDTQPASLDATLDQAFEAPAEGSEPSDPSAQIEPAKDASAATTAQPQATTDPKAQTTGDKGAPPPDKWEHVLANARTKARDEALAEHREALEVVKELRTDFAGTLTRMLEEAAEHPEYSDAITAKAAALLNARKQRGRVDEEPQPDAVMRYEDGTTEPTFSPAQQRKWAEWRERQMKAGLLNEFKPLLDMQQQFKTVQERAKVTQEAATIAAKRSESWKTMPLFEDNRAAILERQQALYADAATQPGFDAVNGPWELLQQAYAEVIGTHALPKLQSQQTQTLVADAARKRAASSGDPAASLPAQPRRPRTVDEALDQGFGVSA
jgi:hypothetical protein